MVANLLRKVSQKIHASTIPWANTARYHDCCNRSPIMRILLPPLEIVLLFLPLFYVSPTCLHLDSSRFLPGLLPLLLLLLLPVFLGWASGSKLQICMYATMLKLLELWSVGSPWPYDMRTMSPQNGIEKDSAFRGSVGQWNRICSSLREL